MDIYDYFFNLNIKVVYLQKKYNLKNNNNGRKEF